MSHRKASREEILTSQFFYEPEAWQELKGELHREARRAAIAGATGISDQQVLDELASLDIGVESLSAITLAPMARVAWASGAVEKGEWEAVLRNVHSRNADPDGARFRLLNLWLRRRPQVQMLEAWRDFAEDIARQLSPESRRRLCQQIVGQAQDVAKAAGGVFGIGATSPGEAEVIEEIRRAFDIVDDG